MHAQARHNAWLATIQNGIARWGCTQLPQMRALGVVRCVHMDSGCEMFGSVAVHCGRTDPLGAQGRLDTGVVLAKNLFTYCFGVCQNLPRRAFVLAIFLLCHLSSFRLEDRVAAKCKCANLSGTCFNRI